jgi:hypothetical protein
MLVTESSGTIEIIRRVQANPVLVSAIERTAEGLKVDGLCHGDIRLDNLLCGPSPRLVLVDWELAGVGATAWDLGCLLAGFAEFWVTGAVPHRDYPGSAITSTKRSLLRFKPMLQRFWKEYSERVSALRCGYSWQKRLPEMVGIRLIQSALEYSQLSTIPTRESILLLTLAERFVKHPLECWVHLLGLPLSNATGRISLE